MRITTSSGEVLGEADLPAQNHRMSQALFCPGCGEVWARVERSKTWYSLTRWCGRRPECENAYAVPGSFFGLLEESHDVRDFLQFPSFLRREFVVQLAWAERFPPGAQAPIQGELI